jgi:tRNA pseudouridine38-40 synthase
MRWKLILEYDGTNYSGWQEQRNARTVAGDLRKAAEQVLGDKAEVNGAGRTDAGVHALAQVAVLKSACKIRTEKLLRGLNHELPKDINILLAEEAKGPFHPRHDALNRYYLYQISTRRTAFAKRYVWWINEPLNLESMHAAAALLPGRHDFERFCEKRGDEDSTIVVVQRAELKRSGDLILFRIGASHFVWKMVRRLVGTLAEVGCGKLTPDDMALLLKSHPLPQRMLSYSVASHTAPASGLFLERVAYSAAEEPDELLPAAPVHGNHVG